MQIEALFFKIFVCFTWNIRALSLANTIAAEDDHGIQINNNSASGDTLIFANVVSLFYAIDPFS